MAVDYTGHRSGKNDKTPAKLQGGAPHPVKVKRPGSENYTGQATDPRLRP